METPSPRLQYLIDHYGAQLAAHLKSHERLEYTPDETECVLLFSEVDPSRNKSATQWLIKTFLRDGFRFEDIADKKESKVFETLAMFGLHRKNLDVSKRDLNQYVDLSSLWKSIEKFVLEAQMQEINAELNNSTKDLEGRALRRAEKEKAYRESEILIEREDGFKIVVPKTEFASCWWGRGTRWCTAAEKSNYFSKYNLISPLFILLMPNGEKVQLYVDGHQHQFMDASDQELTKEYIAENWDKLGPLIIHLMQTKNENIFSILPQEAYTQELCDTFIERNPYLLSRVPFHLRNSNMCYGVLKNNFYIGDNIPYAFFQESRYQKLLSGTSSLLIKFPTQYWTQENIIKAILDGSDIFHKISKEKFDKEICEALFKKSHRSLVMFPDEFKTYDMCHIAISISGDLIYHIPEKLLNRDLILTALVTHSESVKLLKEYPLDLLKECIKTNPKCVEHIPEEILMKYQTELYRVFKNVLQKKKYLEIIPPKIFMTKEMLMIFAQNLENVDFDLPSDLKSDPEIWMEFLKHGHKVFYDIPRKILTKEMCILAIKNGNVPISRVPEEFLDEDLALQYLRIHPLRIGQVSNTFDNIDFIEDDIYVDILNKITIQHEMLHIIPERFFTEEIVKKLLYEKDFMYLYLPDNFVSKEYLLDYIESLKSSEYQDSNLEGYLARRFSELQIEYKPEEPKPKWTPEDINIVAELYREHFEGISLNQAPC